MSARRETGQIKLLGSEIDTKEMNKSIMDVFPFIVWYKDLEGKYIMVNKQFADFCGHSFDEIIGKTDYEVWTADLAKMYRLIDMGIISQRESKYLEEEVLVKGASVWYEKWKAPLVDSDGNVTGVVGFAYDITSRKMLEMKLREQQQYDERILTTIPSAVFSIDRNGKINSWNRRMMEITGYTEQEVLGRECNFFTEEPCKSVCGLRGEREKPIYSIECDIRTKSGQYRHISKNIDILLDENGDFAGGVECLEDITDRKEIEEKLREKEAILSAVALSVKELLDNRDIILAVKNCLQIIGEAVRVDRVYLFQNETDDAGNLYSSQKQEWHSDKVSSDLDNSNFKMIPFAVAPKLHDLFKKGRPFGGLVKDLPEEMLREMLGANGIKSLLLFPVMVNNFFWGFIGFDECKSERKWTPTEFSTLSAFVDSLGKSIERNMIEKELELSWEAAESANIHKSQFLANMSHEIRTPMNGIVGFLDLLGHTGLTSEQKSYVREAKNASDILLYLINDILDFSKIEAGKLMMENINFSMRTVIEDAVALHTPRAAEKDVRLCLNIEDSVPDVLRGDPGRLRQVVNNLISNAVKFTEAGKVTVGVQALEITDGFATLQIEVEDTGIGIQEESLERLFKPFVQADASATRKYGGTGLGLAISKELIKMMGGEIYVKSTYGEGSLFGFSARFMVVEETEENNKTGMDLLNNIRILIVDDNHGNRKVYSTYLEEVGAIVYEAATSEQAIMEVLSRANSNEKIDVALVDLHIPGMSGFDLATTFSSIPAAKEIKLVLITASAREGDVERSKELGFFDYLLKPVRRDDLVNCIVNLTNRMTVKESTNLTKEEITVMKPRILLVEDNVMNMKIVQAMLKMHGMSCDIALNGENAFNDIMKHDYDLVFMDCQMPVMDGYESTAMIRDAEGADKHTFIVAMTANAMSGDKEKCLSSGMDDYLSKPIDFDEMFRLIEKYRKMKAGSNKFPEMYEDALHNFIKDTGLDFDDAQDLFREYMGLIPDRMKEMAKVLGENDYDSLKGVAHQLKGASGTLRITHIYHLCMDLEAYAVKRDKVQCEAILRDMKSFVF